jgi:hypothetical protein
MLPDRVSSSRGRSRQTPGPPPHARRPRRYGMLAPVATSMGVQVMAKGLDKKKETKKKPAKTLKEKRSDKNEKKATRGFSPG